MSAPVLAHRCDAVIVVVRAGRTSRQALERTLQLLRDARIAGIVLNRRSSSVPRWAEAALALRPWKSA
jgi:Mrp family chromosome partitioning ATPase